jgi:hypothetical protein
MSFRAFICNLIYVLAIAFPVGALAQSNAAVCDVVSEHAASNYSRYYDNYLTMYKNSKPNSKERKNYIRLFEEEHQKTLDDVSISYADATPSRKALMIAVYGYCFGNMSNQASHDALENVKQPKERIQRIVYMNCLSAANR